MSEAMQLSLEGQACPTFPEMKKCSKCGEMKAREAFNKRSGQKDGMSCYCRKCVQAYYQTHKEEHKEKRRVCSQAYYQLHKEEEKAYGKAYHQAHKDKHNACTRAYHQAHKDEANVRRHAHRMAHPDASSIYKNKVRMSNPQLIWSRRTIYAHKLRGHVIVISIDELFEMAQKVTLCPICDCEINWLKKGKNGPAQNSPSLDRKYNGKRISKDTCWIICHRCNVLKSNLPLPEYVEHCKRVVERFDSKVA